MEAIRTPSTHHFATMPRRIFAASGEELFAVPEEAAVVIEGALPPSCPDSLEARREMGRTVKVKADTLQEAGREIQAWWGGVRGRHKGKEALALYARFGGEWHAVRIGAEFVVPKRASITLNEELLLAACEAEGSRFVVRWKLEDYLSSLVPGQAPRKSSVPRSHAKAAPIVQPGPTIRLSDLPPPATSPILIMNGDGKMVLDAAALNLPVPPPEPAAVSPATPTVTPTVTPTPAPTPSTPTKAPAPVPSNLPPYATTWPGPGPGHKTAAPLTVEVVENVLPEEIADLIDTMALPPGTFYETPNADSILLFLPPAALNGDPKNRLTSRVEVRRAKLPQSPQPWVCTLKVGTEEVTSKIHKEARDAVDNALVLTAKTKLAPYRKALSVFLGGP